MQLEAVALLLACARRDRAGGLLLLLLLQLLLAVTFVVRCLTDRTAGGAHYTLVGMASLARQCRITLTYQLLSLLE